MNARYWILKYVDDIARMEPRNIGVLLRCENMVMGRFLGEREGNNLDLRTVRGVVSHTGAYKQWVSYWRHALRESGSADEAVHEVLDSLRGNYIAGEEARVTLPDVAPTQALSYLFHALVTEFPSARGEELSLASRVDEIIRTYRLRDSPYFHESPVVVCQFDERLVEHIRPHYGWINGQAVYFQKVSINEAKIDLAQKEVHNAAWIFERLRRSQPEAQTNALVKVVGTDSGAEARAQSQEYLELLSRLSSRVVNVDDDTGVHSVFASLTPAS